jgi:flavin-dependent dehydrogenase
MAKKGWRVGLVAPPFSAERSIGETVPGVAKLLLRELGLWRAFQDEGHRPAYARRSVWGDESIQEQSCLFDPDGSGFHLDRARFDRWLCEQASASGVHALTAAPKRLEMADDGRIAALVLKNEEGDLTITARYFADTTGRAGWLASRMGAQRAAPQELVAAARWYEGDTGTPVMLVQSTPEGWWYTAPLPGSLRVALWVTDAGSDFARAGSSDGLWQQCLDSAPHVRAALAGTTTLGKAVARRAGPTLTLWDTANNWLPVGDAAAAFDPISGQGLCFALRSALEAASVLEGLDAGKPWLLDAYREGVRRVFELHGRQRAAAYRLEQRWPESPFWRAAQAAPTLSSSVDPRSNEPVSV